LEEIPCRVIRSLKDSPHMHLKNRYEFRSSKDQPNKHPTELSTKPACLKRIDFQLRKIICKSFENPKKITQNNYSKQQGYQAKTNYMRNSEIQ
jgi:hypothetical protein